MSCSDPILVNIISWLQGVKYLNGPNEVQYSLRKHPKIKKYLENYLKDQSIDIENDIDSMLE